MNVFISGGAGFIGSNFARYWIAEHPDDDLVVYDALTYCANLSNLAGIEDVVDLVEGDICDLDKVTNVLTKYSVGIIVNFAAESHNSLAVANPNKFFETNVIGTQRLLEAARRVGVERFHHVSTCEVYGDLDLDSNESFTEDSPYRPRTPYNASKAGADHAVRSYFETFGLPITISNCCNNYGPYQFPEKLIPLFVTNALDGIELPIYQSSQNRREWLHVDDHCRAIEMIVTQGKIGETYNVGSGYEASIEQVADAILNLVGASDKLKKIVADRPGHDRRYLLDSSKVRESIGWVPYIEFDEGLVTTIEWYRSNRKWWESAKERIQVDETNWIDPNPSRPNSSNPNSSNPNPSRPNPSGPKSNEL